jgi:hypothetical protein
MSGDAGSIATTAAWIATTIGLAMWLWSWFGEKNAIQKLRFRDCGMVLVFSAILVRIAAQDRPLTALDWGLVVLGPVFIGAALWRLSRTGSLPGK